MTDRIHHRCYLSEVDEQGKRKSMHIPPNSCAVLGSYWEQRISEIEVTALYWRVFYNDKVGVDYTACKQH